MGLTSDTGLQPDAQATYDINSRKAVPDPCPAHAKILAAVKPANAEPGLAGEGSTGPSHRYARLGLTS